MYIRVDNRTYQTDDNWIEIEYRPRDDDQEEMDAGFTYKGNWKSLDNYIRTSPGPWNSEPDHYNAGLHARDITSYYKPDYIELDDNGEAVKVYEEV